MRVISYFNETKHCINLFNSYRYRTRFPLIIGIELSTLRLTYIANRVLTAAIRQVYLSYKSAQDGRDLFCIVLTGLCRSIIHVVNSKYIINLCRTAIYLHKFKWNISSFFTCYFHLLVTEQLANFFS